MAWVIRTKHTGKLYAGRVDGVPHRPCVIVFETKQQAMRMHKMMTMMRPQHNTNEALGRKLTGNWLIDNASKLKPPYQPLSIEKWALSSVLSVCSTSALDVAFIPHHEEAEVMIYPAKRDACEDVRFSLDCMYMYGGAISDPSLN